MVCITVLRSSVNENDNKEAEITTPLEDCKELRYKSSSLPLKEIPLGFDVKSLITAG